MIAMLTSMQDQMAIETPITVFCVSTSREQRKKWRKGKRGVDGEERMGKNDETGGGGGRRGEKNGRG